MHFLQGQGGNQKEYLLGFPKQIKGGQGLHFFGGGGLNKILPQHQEEGVLDGSAKPHNFTISEKKT